MRRRLPINMGTLKILTWWHGSFWLHGTYKAPTTCQDFSTNYLEESSKWLLQVTFIFTNHLIDSSPPQLQYIFLHLLPWPLDFISILVTTEPANSMSCYPLAWTQTTSTWIDAGVTYSSLLPETSRAQDLCLETCNLEVQGVSILCE